VTSYFLTPQNNLTVINAAVGDGQAAPSHLTLSGDGTAAFISNTLNGTLSSYQVGPNGGLTLVRPVAAFLGGGAPIDSALSGDSAFLYVLDSALGRIVAYRVQGATLSPLGAIAGLPMTLQGIAAQ
jgi:DNA-binding beta-propeller fold protein YncE